MRIFVSLLAAILVLGWVAFEIRDRNRDLSQILFGFTIVLSLLLFGALFGLLGT